MARIMRLPITIPRIYGTLKAILRTARFECCRDLNAINQFGTGHKTLFIPDSIFFETGFNGYVGREEML